MPEEENTSTKFILPKSRKFYGWLSVAYALCAGDSIWFLFARPRFHITTSHWDLWVDIAIAAYCLWILYEILTALSNHLEKVICLLTMIYFALGIPAYLHELGYSWAHISASTQISTTLLTLAALLIFVRTIQIFTQREAQDAQYSP